MLAVSYGEPTMIFRDTVRISKPVKGPYGQNKAAEDAQHVVSAILAARGAVRRGGTFDALAGDATAYLDANDPWLKSLGYNVSGYFLASDKYGTARTYRISNVAIGERHATDGSISHVEVELEEVK